MPQVTARLARFLRNGAWRWLILLAKVASLFRGREVPPAVGVIRPHGDSERAEDSIARENLDAAATDSADLIDGSGIQTEYQSERERLIRRRWSETGIKMWNAELHGSGRAALNIQGKEGVLPITVRQKLAAYDELEFKLIGNCIICEGVAIEPPAARRPAAIGH